MHHSPALQKKSLLQDYHKSVEHYTGLATQKYSYWKSAWTHIMEEPLADVSHMVNSAPQETFVASDTNDLTGNFSNSVIYQKPVHKQLEHTPWTLSNTWLTRVTITSYILISLPSLPRANPPWISEVQYIRYYLLQRLTTLQR